MPPADEPPPRRRYRFLAAVTRMLRGGAEAIYMAVVSTMAVHTARTRRFRYCRQITPLFILLMLSLRFARDDAAFFAPRLPIAAVISIFSFFFFFRHG